MVCDAAGVVRYANDSACDVLDRRRRTLVGRPMAEVLAPVDQLSAGGGQAELTIDRGGGDSTIVGYSMARSEGTTVVLFRDISQVVALRGERDRLLRLAAVGEVLPSLLHELRNPLAAITSAVEVLVEDTEGQSLQGELHAILSELRRMDLGFQGLGSVGRSLASERAQAVDFAVEEAARVMRPAMEAAGLKLTVVQPMMPLLRLDASVVRAVMFNLLTNSMHACRAGGEIVVRSGLVEEGAGYRLAVADTGKGMDSSVLERCTELFFSTKLGGSGIGLALCERAARHAGGQLDIWSVIDGGTVVALEVPLERGSQREG